MHVQLLETRADLSRELFEVFETILKERVNSAAINIQIVMHQNVPQAGHGNEPPG